MFFYFNGNGLFKFGASDERHLEHRANNLVMWDGMREAVARGVGHLHLGRTDLGHDGLRRFKLSLGATEKPLHYYRFDLAGQRWVEAAPNKARSLSSAVFRRLPLTLNQLAGTVLYPHLH